MAVEREWRCIRCSKLLGIHNGVRVHIRLARGHEYLVGLPVTGMCKSCGTLNEYNPPTQNKPEHMREDRN